MMFPKTKRVENEGLLEIIRAMKCKVCGRRPPSDAHHIKTRGSGGGDTPDNLIALCREHHQEWHKIGMAKMRSKYLHLDYLLKESPFKL